MVEVANFLRSYWGVTALELMFPVADTEPDERGNWDTEMGTVSNVRIGQEGRWLVIRPTNPLAGLEVPNCQFYQIGMPDCGQDENGAFIRWPLNDATLL